jgi:hypothetical protein
MRYYEIFLNEGNLSIIRNSVECSLVVTYLTVMLTSCNELHKLNVSFLLKIRLESQNINGIGPNQQFYKRILQKEWNSSNYKIKKSRKARSIFDDITINFAELFSSQIWMQVLTQGIERQRSFLLRKCSSPFSPPLMNITSSDNTTQHQTEWSPFVCVWVPNLCTLNAWMNLPSRSTVVPLSLRDAAPQT